MLEQGLAQFREARGLWMPTPEGKQVAADLVARELKDAGVEEGLREAYPAFLELNEQFKALCGDWQLFPGEGDNRAPNDHCDPDYDAAIVGRLVALDRLAQGCCVVVLRPSHPVRALRAAARPPPGSAQGGGPEAVHRRDVRLVPRRVDGAAPRPLADARHRSGRRRELLMAGRFGCGAHRDGHAVRRGRRARPRCGGRRSRAGSRRTATTASSSPARPGRHPRSPTRSSSTCSPRSARP